MKLAQFEDYIIGKKDYPVGQCCVDILNLDDALFDEINQRVRANRVKTPQTTWGRKVYSAWPKSKLQKGNKMKISQFEDYSELPLFLNAELVAKVLGVSPSSGYGPLSCG